MVIPSNQNNNNFSGCYNQQNIPCCNQQHMNLPCCESLYNQQQMPYYPLIYRRRPLHRRRRRFSPNLYNILNKIRRPRHIEIPPLPPPPPRPPRQFYKPIIQQMDPQILRDLEKCRCKLGKCKGKRCECEQQLSQCMCNMEDCQCQMQQYDYKLREFANANENCQCQLEQCMCGGQ